jgi:hypothetical protein
MAIYRVNRNTRAQILDNHRFGARRNKSEFPAGWSDNDILDGTASPR